MTKVSVYDRIRCGMNMQLDTSPADGTNQLGDHCSTTAMQQIPFLEEYQSFLIAVVAIQVSKESKSSATYTVGPLSHSQGRTDHDDDYIVQYNYCINDNIDELLSLIGT